MEKKHTGPQIVAKLRQADVLLGQRKSVPGVCEEINVSDHTYYRWRRIVLGLTPLRSVRPKTVMLRTELDIS
jgi:hypothetical protein